MELSKFLFCFRKITNLTFPIVGVRLLYIAVNFLGMVFIAKLGKIELAAGASVTALSTTMMVLAMSPLLATSIIASRIFGSGKFSEAGKVLNQAWVVSIVVGIIVFAIMWNLSWFLDEIHQPAELIPLIHSYFHAMAWGVVPALVMASCHQFCFAIHRGRLVIIWGILTLALTLLLGYPLIYGYLGLPKLGMAGWPWAVSIVNIFMIIGVLIYFYCGAEFKKFELFHKRNFLDYTSLKNFLSIGWPITIQFSGELLAFAMLNLMVGWLGINALSIQQILIQCSSVALMIPMGAGQACAILIGQSVGRKEIGLVQPIAYMGIAFVSICMIILAAIYILFPNYIISLYLPTNKVNNVTLMELGKLMLIIIAFSQLVDAIRNVTIGALRGMQDTWQPMKINLVFLWLFGLPFSYMLGFIFHFGLIGLNMGFLVAFFLGAVAMVFRLNQKVVHIESKMGTVRATNIVLEEARADIQKESI